MASAPVRATCAPSNVIPFGPRPDARRLRADVPPFDPTNPTHLRAWENLWDFGQRALADREGR